MKKLSRRRFVKSAIQGGSSLPFLTAAPYVITSNSNKEKDRDNEKLGVALVGLGNYSRGQLASALQETQHCELRGIVSGTPEKEIVWGEKYNIPKSNIYNYNNFEDIADNPDIDIVYVVLPNVMHAEYSIKAAEAGKHVICEKPMATSVADCHSMINASKKAGKKLSIGYRLHFEPYNLEMMRLGQHQEFGKINEIRNGHAYNINDPYIWRVDKYMSGGGPLMDLGVYSVQGAIYTLGEIPSAVTATMGVRRWRIFHEVEEYLEWEFDFPSGAKGYGKTSYGDSMNYLEVKAENGTFGNEPSYPYGGIQGYTPGGQLNFEEVNQQALQMDDFAKRIKNNEPTPVPGEMGLRDVAIMEAIYHAAETGRKISIDPDYKPIHKV